MNTERRGTPRRVAVGQLGGLPIDPDIEPEGEPRPRRRSRWPHLQLGVVLAVFIGGFFGGLVRYGLGEVFPTPTDRFPWTTFAINLSGAFLLALLLVLVLVLVLEVLPPTRLVRPALGTGFLGAYTTFSSLAVSTDQLIAHGHVAIAAAYAIGSLVGGLFCAFVGVVAGRAVRANRHRRSTRERKDR